MKPIISYINNILFSLIPEGRCFGLKRQMLRLAGAKVGRNVRISSSIKILGAGNLSIGDNTWIGYDCMIVSSSNIEIGANVDIAPRVYIGTGSHAIDINSEHIAALGISKDVRIGNGSWICANSTILPGVEIGNKCVVAAGSVVTRSISDYSLVGGVPARIIRELK